MLLPQMRKKALLRMIMRVLKIQMMKNKMRAQMIAIQDVSKDLKDNNRN